jgi:methylthioribose-1-phosphate isomerase
VAWRDDAVAILDQTLLPREERVLELRTSAQVIDAIQRLAVRGAPAIGVCAAYGVVLIVDELGDTATPDALAHAAEPLAGARPTAVNLRAAVDRAVGAAHDARSPVELRERVLAAADALAREDAQACKRIGEHGRELLAGAQRILTVCNAGRLATAGIGTALGVVYAKAAAGDAVSVLACETRPLLQGGRLTAWELTKAGIPVTVIPDSAAASALAAGRVDAVIAGCDRVAANGDVANKIGTYALAVLARHHGVPFYVAGPQTTIDPQTATGAEIVVEQRSPDEVRTASGLGDDVDAWNPAFDVTPAELITAIVTDAGVLAAPYGPAIAALAL